MNRHDYPHVTVSAPVSRVKDYVMDEWLRHISSLDYPNYSIVLVDNSQDKFYHKHLKDQYPHVTLLRYDSKRREPHFLITESQNKARTHFLRSGSEYFMSIECDVFPPADVIRRLISHRKQATAGVYPIGEGCMRHIYLCGLTRNRYELKQHEMGGAEALSFMDGTLREAHSAGLGCVLLEREVIEKIKFRYVYGRNEFSDTYFALDMESQGIQLYVDTSVLCRHKSDSWAEKNMEITGKLM